MPVDRERLQTALDGYAKFLREKGLALPKHQPYLVRWVRELLLFAQGHSGYTFEQTLDMFLADVGGRVGVNPWQVRQREMRVLDATVTPAHVAGKAGRMAFWTWLARARAATASS